MTVATTRHPFCFVIVGIIRIAERAAATQHGSAA